MSDEAPIGKSCKDWDSVRREVAAPEALWSLSEAEGEQLGSASTDWANSSLTTVRREAPFGRELQSAKSAWQGSSHSVKAGATLTAVATAVCVVALSVPLASGLVVITLIPAMLIDLHERRIPDAWIAMTAASFATALAISAAIGHVVSTPAAIAGAAMMALPILLLHLVSPDAMGFGDVKASIVLGAALGLVNWQLAMVGLTLAAGIGATVGTMRRTRTIAFGPYLLVGTLVALAANSILLDTALKGGGR